MSKKAFNVSVIIPVWNAAKFVQKAVHSVLVQEEVKEIILVEDNSPDNALEICRQLEIEYDKIKLLRHPNGENRGASASRNLGVAQAKCDYVAFLDADDWYLPNRFKKDKEVFFNNLEADVVYSYTILNNQSRTEKKNLLKNIRSVLGRDISPKEFYRFVIENRYPPFHMNSITIKRSFMNEGKLFDERLELHEDSELYKRWLRKGYFYCGEEDRPVAVVRRHEENRIPTRNLESKLFMLAIFIDNVGVQNLFRFEKYSLVKNILRAQTGNINSNIKRRLTYYMRLGLAYWDMDNYLQRFYQVYLPKASQHFESIVRAKMERKTVEV